MMTNEELLQWARRARREAVKVGSMSGLWDVITDAEAIAQGERSICTREQIEDIIRKECARR